LYSAIPEDDRANLHLQGNLSKTTARNFKKLVVYVKVKVLVDHQYQRKRVERVRETFTRSPRKSTTRASLELQMLQQTVWKGLWKRLRMIPYKLQLIQALSCDDKRVRYSFCMSMQQWNEEDDFFNRLIFGDESTFQLSSRVNEHNVHIWGTENPRELLQ